MKAVSLFFLILAAAAWLCIFPVVAQNVDFVAALAEPDITGGTDVSAVAISENRLFLTNAGSVVGQTNPGYLRVFDIGNIHTPSLVGYHHTYDFFMDLALSGDRAFVAYAFDFGSSIGIYDAGDPSTPTLASLYDPSGWVASGGAMALDGDIGYVAVAKKGDGPSELLVLDISDPTSASTRAMATLGSTSAHSIALGSDRVYLASSLFIHILSRPRDSSIPPASLGHASIGSSSVLLPGIASRGNLAYLARDDLQIFDCADPAAPQTIGQFPAQGNARWVAVSGQTVFLVESSPVFRLYVLDASNPANPKQVGYYSNADYEITGRPSVRDGRDIFLPTKNAGVVLLRYTGPVLSAAGREWGEYE